jgi:flagellar motor switch protein FliN/FliY
MADTQTAEAETTEQTEQAPEASDDSVQVQEANLPESADKPTGGGNGQIDILLDSVIPVSVQLGQTSVQVQKLLQMGPGSVLKLDRKAGEPVDVFLRGTKFATGQLVVVGEHIGVRIKEILSPATDQDNGEEG